jgi:hypothetical protein
MKIPILNHMNILWRLAKYLSASITPFIYRTPTHLLSRNSPIYRVNVFYENLRNLANREIN